MPAAFCPDFLPACLYAQGVPIQNLIPTGTGSFQGAGSAADGTTSEIVRQDHDQDFHNSIPSPASAPTSAADPASPSVIPGSPGNFGFIGISHLDQRIAGTGIYANTQFSLEPPDQAFCVGNGYAVESVNTALRVYSAASGAPLTGVIALNQFFGLTPEVIRTAPVTFGDFTSDPKCLYDSASGRFFLTVLQLDVAPSTGAFTGPSSVRIAVSQTGNPTGEWNLFKLDTTDDGTHGTPKHANCPCLGDQPLIGLNKDAFFISTNEFPQFVNGFNGAQVYAVSKQDLLNANGRQHGVVHIDAGSIPAPDGGIWYSLQPANAPPNTKGDGDANDTEFFVSALDFNSTLDNRIAVWALTNTSKVGDDDSSDVNLENTLVSTETYGQPPNARQKSGPGIFQPELLNANDDRMNQVVYANGNLYSGVNTVLGTGNTARAGIAYFVVKPSLHGDRVSASITNQGYVSAPGNDVLFPSIGVNNAGDGFMGFTLAGPDYFPSSAYATIGASGPAGPVTISKAGVAPEDGFTGAVPGGVARWGDYSASYADEYGNIWVATESIPSTTARTALANWGTFITRLTPSPHSGEKD
jgi:hypothetical protein